MSEKKSVIRRLCGCGVTLGILAAGAYGLWWWLGEPDAEDFKNFDFGDFSDVLGNLTGDGFGDLFDNWNIDQDPFVGDNSTSNWPQDNRGQGGLTLQIQNALDDTWTQEFGIAVSDWENGTPDPLTLPTVKVATDRACSQVNGVMKVCNGNYGDTGWLGINELLLITQRGVETIQSSVAKMNEYYLLNADFIERRYTMCHEIGHGFGLPHTDEIFTNTDLGNCLDYTKKPQNNILPGQVNFDKLVGMYGTVDGASRRRRVTETRELTAQERATYEAAMEDLEFEISNGYSTSSKWRLLSYTRGSRGEHYERNLGNGYTLRVKVLFPIQD
jgi:hypothetical protein